MAESKETYPIKLFCGNCYNGWIKRFEKGKDVEERGCFNSMTLFDGNFIKCPKCGSSKVSKVKIEMRE